MRERVEDVEIFKPKVAPVAPVPAAKPSAKLFDSLRKFELMAFAAPEEWVNWTCSVFVPVF